MTFFGSKRVNMTVRDLSKGGAVPSTSAEAGANNIFGASYSVADQAALEAQARDPAMADAKARATQLAKDAGTSLDSPITISEGVNNGPIPIFGARDAAAPQSAG